MTSSDDKQDLKEFTKFCEAGSELRDGDTEVGSALDVKQISHMIQATYQLNTFLTCFQVLRNVAK